MGEALSEYYAATGQVSGPAKMGSPRSSSASMVDKLHKFSRTYTKSIVVNTVGSYLWYLSKALLHKAYEGFTS